MRNEEKAKEIAESHKYKTNWQSAMEMAEWKDSKIRDILMTYTLWLDARGFFAEDLQCDFGHQIDTFLEMSKNK